MQFLESCRGLDFKGYKVMIDYFNNYVIAIEYSVFFLVKKKSSMSKLLGTEGAGEELCYWVEAEHAP